MPKCCTYSNPKWIRCKGFLKGGALRRPSKIPILRARRARKIGNLSLCRTDVFLIWYQENLRFSVTCAPSRFCPCSCDFSRQACSKKLSCLQAGLQLFLLGALPASCDRLLEYLESPLEPETFSLGCLGKLLGLFGFYQQKNVALR